MERGTPPLAEEPSFPFTIEQLIENTDDVHVPAVRHVRAAHRDRRAELRELREHELDLPGGRGPQRAAVAGARGRAHVVRDRPDPARATAGHVAAGACSRWRHDGRPRAGRPRRGHAARERDASGQAAQAQEPPVVGVGGGGPSRAPRPAPAPRRPGPHARTPWTPTSVIGSSLRASIAVPTLGWYELGLVGRRGAPRRVPAAGSSLAPTGAPRSRRPRAGSPRDGSMPSPAPRASSSNGC